MRIHTKTSVILSFLISFLLICLSQNQVNSQDFLKKYFKSSLVKDGKQCKSDGDYPSAITKFTKSIKKDPENLEAYYQLGLIFEEIMYDYDKAISLYEKVIILSKGVKQTGSDEVSKEFNTLITDAKTSIDRAIKKKYESIGKPRIPVCIIVKPYKKILYEPKIFSSSKYKTTSYSSEFKLLDFSSNWYQIDVPSIGSGWINGKNVLKITQKEKEAIEISPAGKAALYQRFVEQYPDSRFAQTANDKADDINYGLAKEEGSISSHSIYLKKYPDGKYSEEAKLKKNELAFEDESFLNNINRLKHWIENNPESTFLEKAKNRVEELEFAQSKQQNNNIKNAFSNPVVTNGTLGEFGHGTYPSPPLGKFTHVGVDLVAPCGSNIYAFADGQVKDVIDNTNDKNFDALGYMVLVEHPASLIGKKFYTLYLHLQGPPKKKIGDQVTGGSTVIGDVGNSGKTVGSGCHTHFEIRYFPERFSVWGNIYCPGDQRSSKYFVQNWENPVKFFKKYPKGVTLNQKQEVLSNTFHITMKDGSVFTGTIIPAVMKFESKYGEIEVNVNTITSFSKGVLILNDQSRLKGNFTDINITIKTAYTELSLPISEIVTLSTEAATTPYKKTSNSTQSVTTPSKKTSISTQSVTTPSKKTSVSARRVTTPSKKTSVSARRVTTPSKKTSVSTQGTISSVKRLNRDNAKKILKNLVITKRWCAFPGKCPGKSINIQNPYGFHLEASSAGIEVSRETLLSYLSCLESKGLVKNLSVKKGRKEGFSGWDAWFETTTTGEPWQLTEIGQEYLTDNLDYSLRVVVNKITGIQFSNENTAAKVFFDATIKNSDNPFVKCFEGYFDVRYLLNEPYALFELFDDGWRLQKWSSGGVLKERQQTSTKQVGTENATLEKVEEYIQSANSLRENQSDYNGALDLYKKALELDPDRPSLHWYIAGVYWKLENYKKALEYLEKCRNLFATEEDLKDVDNFIGKVMEALNRKENNEKSDTSNNISYSVFSTYNSEKYHKSDCSELSTEDLIEFDSPEKADAAGAIPCKNCNQLAGGHKDVSNQNKQKEAIYADEPFRTDTNRLITKTTNLTRETATEILKNSKYFPRYRIYNLPIGNSVNVEGLIKSALAVNYQMGQELSVGYKCAKRLGHLSLVGRKRNIFGTQFAPLYKVSVTREGKKYGNVINSEAFGYRQQYAYRIYRTNVYKVTGIRRINQSSSEVEFIYRADNIGQVARCLHPNITPDKTESVGRATFTLFDDGWRVDTVK